MDLNKEIAELAKRNRLLEEALNDINLVLDIKFSSNNENWSQELQDIDIIVTEALTNKLK